MGIPENKDITEETDVHPLDVSLLVGGSLITLDVTPLVGSGLIIMRGEKVLPRGSLTLEVPLISGKPAAQVGICCYAGRFKDGNDLLSHLGTGLLGQKASLKEKGEFYWERFKRRFNGRRRYDIWCPQTVCFQASTSNAPTFHPAEPMKGGA
jgi:hypothetical protein